VNEILDMIAEHAGDGPLVIGGDFNIGIGERHRTEGLVTTKADRAFQTRLSE
jgi:hypothetical protein